MARDIEPRLKGSLQEARVNVDKFNRGLVTLIDESLLPYEAASESRNLMQVMDGRWSPRWGTDYYGTTTGGTITGAATYTTDAGATHIVVVSGTSVKRSDDDGETWDTCTGQTMTAGVKTYFQQIGSYLYIANGTDNLVRYDGTTTLDVYSAVAAPGTITPTKTGLGATTFTASYKVTSVSAVGESAASSAGTVTISKTRDNWTAGTDYITVTWNRVTGAEGYNIYYKDNSTNGDVERYVGSVAQPSSGNLTFVDTGEASMPLNLFVEAPTGDTTQGPKFAQMELSGNRLWATLDNDNPWRVHWSGAGSDIGKFSEYSGGGWVELEKGGRERPKAVVHYRDGRGGAYSTVLTSDPEGVGSIWQISLDAVTIGSTSFTVPTAVKIVGSVGTDAPLSVTKVRNDIFFFNRRGWFSLGTRPQMLNLLSTDEISSNIRPDIKSYTGSALEGVCAYYYDAKVFCSVPIGSSSNNSIYVNDTERRNWSGPWSTGVERFFEYADSTGQNHLLAVPTNGSTLLEVSETIAGDLGVAFDTRYLSGLYPVDPSNRNAFAKIRYAYIELNNPVGDIQFSVLGTKKRGGFQQVKSITISDTVSNVGFSTWGFSEMPFSDTSEVPVVYSQSSVKKRLKINKLLNNIQFKVTTSGRGDQYSLLNLQAKGYIVPTGDPASWKE